MVIRIGNYIAQIEYGQNGEVTGCIQFDELIWITAIANTFNDLKDQLVILIKNFEKHQKAHRVYEISGGYSNNSDAVEEHRLKSYFV